MAKFIAFGGFFMLKKQLFSFGKCKFVEFS